MVAPNAVNAPLRCSKNAAGEKNGETCAWRRASLPSCAERSTRLICCAKLQPIRVRCAVLHAIRAGTRLVFGLSVEKDAFVRHLLYKCLASVDYQRRTLLPTYRIVDFSAQPVRIVSISAQSLSIVLLFAPHTRIARDSAQEPTCKQGRRGSRFCAGANLQARAEGFESTRWASKREGPRCRGLNSHGRGGGTRRGWRRACAAGPPAPCALRWKSAHALFSAPRPTGFESME